MLPDCSKEHDVGARTQYKWFAYAAQSRGLFSSRIAVASGFDGAALILQNQSSSKERDTATLALEISPSSPLIGTCICRQIRKLEAKPS